MGKKSEKWRWRSKENHAEKEMKGEEGGKEDSEAIER